MASIEATASSRRKTKESVRVSSLIPEGIRQNSSNLIRLLEDYYKFMNKGFNPSYELSHIADERNIDTAEHYLNMIQKEIAAAIPRQLEADRVKLYKNLVKYYNVRGSKESVELFFKIILNDNVEVEYPYNSVLIPSNGKWSTQREEYLSNDGFLSDKDKVQDSYYYQKFSYLIKTGNNLDVWADTFDKLVHPAGFIYFGQIAIYLYLLDQNSKMPLLQPGLIAAEDYPLLISIFQSLPRLSVAEMLPTIILLLDFAGEWEIRRKQYYTKLLKFYDDTPMGDFGNYTVQQGINSVIDRVNVGVSVTITDWMAP